MARKKKVLIHSNFSKLFTGFARHKKCIMSYLYKTGKYDLVELANGKTDEDPSFKYVPWKVRGTFPKDKKFLYSISKDPQAIRAANYGAFEVENIIKEEKPDVYLGIEDVWGFANFIDQPWWSKINTALWTTLDSVPLTKDTLKAAAKTKNFFVWASFAEKALKKQGLNHARTIQGIVDGKFYKELSKEEKKQLRKKYNIDEDCFVIGFVFRNQLRKSVPNLLAGFKIFKEKNPDVKAKLLLHTSWKEGWRIKDQAKEKGVDLEDIITTHRCEKCGKFTVENYLGEELDCNSCFAEKSVGSVSIYNGISQKELNEVYNLMDVYCHPFTSGGQEIPIQEAKLAGLITLVTSYACGEDYCYKEVGGLPLAWHPYEEPRTEYIKASTDHDSIAEQLERVLKMDESEKREFIENGKKCVEKLSEENIGAIIEEWIDQQELIEDFSFLEKEREFVTEYEDENADEEDNEVWLEKTYYNIIGLHISKYEDNAEKALKRLESGEATREGIISRLLEISKANKASHENKLDIKDFLDEDDEGRRIAFLLPKTVGDVYMATSLLKGLKETYPDHNIYFFTEASNFELVNESPYIHKLVPYSAQLDSAAFLEGNFRSKGYFEVSLHPHWFTQSMNHYTHNGKDKIQLDLKY